MWIKEMRIILILENVAGNNKKNTFYNFKKNFRASLKTTLAFVIFKKVIVVKNSF